MTNFLATPVNDVFNGSAGTNDTVSYENALAGVVVSLAISSAQNTVGSGTDTLVSIENLTGSAFDDSLTGDDGDNALIGGAGNDTLIGGLGNNTIDGGEGQDGASFDFSDLFFDVEFVNAGDPYQVSYATAYDHDAAILYTVGSAVSVEHTISVIGGSGNDYIGAVVTRWGSIFRGNSGIDNIFLDASGLVGSNGGGIFFESSSSRVSSNMDFSKSIEISGFEGFNFIGSVGDDYLSAVSSRLPVYFNGGLGNDTLYGGLSFNQLYGGDGNDIIFAGKNENDRNNFIDGGDGNDTAILDFSNRPSVIFFYENDVRKGGYAIAGSLIGDYRDIETLIAIGGFHDDIFDIKLSSWGSDIRGNSGFDRLNFDASNLISETGYGIRFTSLDGFLSSLADSNNKIKVAEFEGYEITGTSGRDIINIETATLYSIIVGGSGDDTLTSGSGNDFIDGGLGRNIIDGGAGIDAAAFDFSDQVADIAFINMGQAGIGYEAVAEGVVIGSVKNTEHVTVIGGSGNDRLGGVVTNSGGIFKGGPGNDYLVIDVSSLAIDDSRFPNFSQFVGIRTTNSGPTSITFRVQTLPSEREIAYPVDINRVIVASDFEGYYFTGSVGSDIFVVRGTLDSYLAGGDGDDVLAAGSGDDTFEGGNGNDTLSGGFGDDNFRGGAGNDIIEGGAGKLNTVDVGLTGEGLDVAYFSGARENYTITYSNSTFTTTVIDNRPGSRDGTDTLRGIEYLIFEDLPFNPAPPAAVNAAPIKIGPQSILGDGFEDTVYTITTLQLTRGFADPNNDALAVSAISATNGSVTPVGSGNFTFTPNTNFNGPVSFSYTLSDGRGGTIAANLALTLKPVNDAPYLSGVPGTLLQGRENVTYTIANGTLLAGYSDPEGDAFSVTTIAVNAGTINPGASGSYVLTTPAGFSGLVQLTYQLADSFGAATTVTRTIDIRPENLAPVRDGALASLPSGVEDNAYSVTAQSLLQGYRDPEGDRLSITGLTANHGTVIANADGTFTILPTRNYNGAVTLSYAVSDGDKAIAAGNAFVLKNESNVTIATPARLAPGETGIAKIYRPSSRASSLSLAAAR
jgi:Ca2+-binding RTX toxin-like protein